MEKAKNSSVVFTPYITLKNGKRIYARQYGLKAFCFESKREEKKTSTKK